MSATVGHVPGPLVIAVDVGTTATKVVAYEPSGRAVAEAERGYPLHAPHPGHAEQDPEQIRATAESLLAEVVAAVGPGRVAGVALSSAMHTLMALDGDGRPLTALTSWADTRAQAEADELRAGPGLALHRRTGTPVHPMSPLVRLRWFARHAPQLCDRARWWCGVKEYLLLHLTGRLVVDHSLASASGLLDLASLRWDAEALALAGVTAEQLPELVPTTQALPLAAAPAARVGLPAGTPVVVGGGDGPLANLGVGAVRPGMAACSLGTSGALRVVVDRPVVDPAGRVFCYALAPGLWVVGGAVTNGGIVMRWALEALAPDLGPGAEEALLALAAQAPPGSGGLLMAPYLMSERAPRWTSLGRGAFVGLMREHGRPHMVRAAIEGVALQLALVLDSMRAAGIAVDSVRGTGGVMRSALWQQLLADAFAMPLDLLDGQQGSGYGAAILGMRALGIVDSLEATAAAVRVVRTVEPVPAHVETYARLRPVLDGLYDALAPTFAALRALDLPTLPPR